MTNASILTHTDFKVKSQSHGAGAYCGGHLAAQLVHHMLLQFCDYVVHRKELILL